MSASGRRYVPLLHRVAGINAALVIVAVGITIVVLAPTKISSFAVDEEVIVVLAAVALVVVANVYLLRRVVGPVQALTALARRVDLTNSASSRAELALEHEDGRLILRVRDDGRGLRPGTRAGTGMRGMRERAALIGASLDIGNGSSGPGCEVRLDVPLNVSVELQSVELQSVELQSVELQSVELQSVELPSIEGPSVGGPPVGAPAGARQ